MKTFYGNGESYVETARRLRTRLGRSTTPAVSTICRLIQKYDRTGLMCSIKIPGHPRSQRSAENLAAVRDHVMTSLSKSLRQRSQKLGLRIGTVQNILKEDLKMRAYKIQLVQKLKSADHGKRRIFVDWILAKQLEDDEFVQKIVLF